MSLVRVLICSALSPLLGAATPPVVGVTVDLNPSQVSIADLRQDVQAWDPKDSSVRTLLAEAALSPLKEGIPIFRFCVKTAADCADEYQLKISVQKAPGPNRVALRYS